MVSRESLQSMAKNDLYSRKVLGEPFLGHLGALWRKVLSRQKLTDSIIQEFIHAFVKLIHH